MQLIFQIQLSHQDVHIVETILTLTHYLERKIDFSRCAIGRHAGILHNFSAHVKPKILHIGQIEIFAARGDTKSLTAVALETLVAFIFSAAAFFLIDGLFRRLLRRSSRCYGFPHLLSAIQIRNNLKEAGK